MEKLSLQEEELMQVIWQYGEGSVKTFLQELPGPKPPYTTIASTIKNLEKKGYVTSRLLGNTFMYTLFEYMIKISAWYAVVYLFYWLVLRRLTNYKSNRFYLLITALFAFVIPLLRLDLFINPQTIRESGVINYIPSMNIGAAANT